MQLFERLIKKYSTKTTFFIADVIEVFEELETGLDLARNDQALDPVVHLGANRAIFILGKYYAKLDDCEIYPIALGECFSVFDFHIVTLCFAFSTGSKKNRQVDQEKQRMAI